MTEPNPNIDERLARLAARRNPEPSPDPPAERSARHRRRRHPAAAGRILSVGLSSSAFLSLVAAFAQTGASGASAASVATAPPRPAPIRTRIVVRDVHHTIYVDQFGRPVAVASAVRAGPGTATIGGHATTGTGSAADAAGPAPAITPGLTRTTAPTPPGASRQPPASGPSPTTIPVLRPPTPTTRPPAPPTTVVTTPPPPPAPPCTGSKCK